MFQLAALSLNDDMYHELKVALILGYWRSGETLTPYQRKVCQEVVSVRESYYVFQPETQQLASLGHRQETHPICMDDFFEPSNTYQ